MEKRNFLLFSFIVIFFIGFMSPLNIHSNPYFKNKYSSLILTMANKYNIPVELIHSIIQAESDYNKWAVSSKGAKGLMQLMPETAKDYGVKDIFDPRENIEAGVKYLVYLIKRYKGKTNLVLAAYNAGPENVKKYKGVPPYKETKSYIETIEKLYGEQYITLTQSVRKFYDQSGKLVLTNYPSSYFSDRQKE